MLLDSNQSIGTDCSAKARVETLRIVFFGVGETTPARKLLSREIEANSLHIRRQWNSRWPV